jgi:hypothetical protein
LSHNRSECVAALDLLGAVGLRAVVVREVAGAVHGWPLKAARECATDSLRRFRRGLLPYAVLDCSQ